MIYISFGEDILEIIATADNLLGKETVISVVRKEIPPGIIIDGLINDFQKLLSLLNEAFAQAYPKPIKGKEITVVTADNYDLVRRFEINSSTKDPAKEVIETVKKISTADPMEMENFYQVLETKNAISKIYYAAMSKNTILNCLGFLKSGGYKLSFLTYQSVSFFSLIKNMMGEAETILYSDIEKSSANFIVYDKLGFVKGYRKKITTTFKDAVNDILKDLSLQNNITITKLFIGGAGSLNIHENDLAGLSGLNLIKMSDVMEEILIKNKIELDTGGIPKMFFSNSLSLLLFSKSPQPANFIMDFKPEKIDRTDSPSSPKPKKSLLLPLIAAVLGFIIVMVGFIFIKNNKNNPGIFSLTAPTPTVTTVPTNTPTPTIDSSLKRSDLKVSVENGTEKSGYAKEMGTYLEGKGYRNTDKTNADKTDYENTIIRIKDKKKNYLPLFISDIREKMDTSTVETLDDTSLFDVKLILGKK